MSSKKVVYLGPQGTYSHLVAEKRFGKSAKYIPRSTIFDVCSMVSGNRDMYGVVPIENSSGGAIYETVDILLAGKPKIVILEEMWLDVRLALIGHKGVRPRVLYSHFAPMEHCMGWIRKNLSGVEKRVMSSTAAAAGRALAEMDAVVLGSRRLAKLYNLDVLCYPVKTDLPNQTSFLLISGRGRAVNATKTTLAVKLLNEPGSLCSFLDVFRSRDLNLTRLVSRPIRGCPGQYTFLIDIDGGVKKKGLKPSINEVRSKCPSVRLVGSYPVRKPYKS